MIDMKTLELIKNNKFDEGVNFPEELHQLIKSFYENFDLDRMDEEYRYQYIMNFIKQHEAFIVNYQTNVYNPNLKATDKLSEEITFNKFLDTISMYLTKYYEEDGQTASDFQKREA